MKTKSDIVFHRYNFQFLNVDKDCKIFLTNSITEYPPLVDKQSESLHFDSKYYSSTVPFQGRGP